VKSEEFRKKEKKQVEREDEEIMERKRDKKVHTDQRAKDTRRDNPRKTEW
jgi:hypothetical protein